MKTLDKISFQELLPIPALIQDFLADKLPSFEGNRFTWAHLQNKKEEKKNSYSKTSREVLVEALKEQYQDYSLSEKQLQNLERLKDENTFTVTTGHQLNLFTGPVFFVYKILQTIKTADEINKQNLDFKAVPIFWLASEDHDFDEIHHFRTENNYYEINEPHGGAVGRIKIRDQDFIHQFEEEFRGWPHGEELIVLLKSAYAQGNTLVDSTKILVQTLFSEYGVLVLDGDTRKLKEQMKIIFKDELLNESLKTSTNEIVSLLEEKYHKVQVNPREINLFYLSTSRNRIEKVGDIYRIVDTAIQFTKEEILNELELYPERFSPNALMRPVYQETVLPNLMYIGGNAEIMYWFELKDYFKKINLPYPILTPRNSMLFLTQKLSEKIQRLNWKTRAIFEHKEDLIKRFLVCEHPIRELLDEKEEALKQHFTELKEASRQTDITFAQLVDAEETRQLKSFIRMRKRLLRAERIKNEEWISRVERLWLAVHPKNVWQERVLNFSVFYSILGKDWLQICYKEQDILKPQMVVIEY